MSDMDIDVELSVLDTNIDAVVQNNETPQSLVFCLRSIQRCLEALNEDVNGSSDW